MSGGALSAELLARLHAEHSGPKPPVVSALWTDITAAVTNGTLSSSEADALVTIMFSTAHQYARTERMAVEATIQAAASSSAVFTAKFVKRLSVTAAGYTLASAEAMADVASFPGKTALNAPTVPSSTSTSSSTTPSSAASSTSTKSTSSSAAAAAGSENIDIELWESLEALQQAPGAEEFFAPPTACPKSVLPRSAARASSLLLRWSLIVLSAAHTVLWAPTTASQSVWSSLLKAQSALLLFLSSPNVSADKARTAHNSFRASLALLPGADEQYAAGLASTSAASKESPAALAGLYGLLMREAVDPVPGHAWQTHGADWTAAYVAAVPTSKTVLSSVELDVWSPVLEQASMDSWVKTIAPAFAVALKRLPKAALASYAAAIGSLKLDLSNCLGPDGDIDMLGPLLHVIVGSSGEPHMAGVKVITSLGRTIRTAAGLAKAGSAIVSILAGKTKGKADSGLPGPVGYWHQRAGLAHALRALAASSPLSADDVQEAVQTVLEGLGPVFDSETNDAVKGAECAAVGAWLSLGAMAPPPAALAPLKKLIAGTKDSTRRHALLAVCVGVTSALLKTSSTADRGLAATIGALAEPLAGWIAKAASRPGLRGDAIVSLAILTSAAQLGETLPGASAPASAALKGCKGWEYAAGADDGAVFASSTFLHSAGVIEASLWPKLLASAWKAGLGGSVESAAAAAESLVRLGALSTSFAVRTAVTSAIVHLGRPSAPVPWSGEATSPLTHTRVIPSSGRDLLIEAFVSVVGTEDAPRSTLHALAVALFCSEGSPKVSALPATTFGAVFVATHSPCVTARGKTSALWFRLARDSALAPSRARGSGQANAVTSGASDMLGAAGDAAAEFLASDIVLKNPKADQWIASSLDGLRTSVGRDALNKAIKALLARVNSAALSQTTSVDAAILAGTIAAPVDVTEAKAADARMDMEDPDFRSMAHSYRTVYHTSEDAAWTESHLTAVAVIEAQAAGKDESGPPAGGKPNNAAQPAKKGARAAADAAAAAAKAEAEAQETVRVAVRALVHPVTVVCAGLTSASLANPELAEALDVALPGIAAGLSPLLRAALVEDVADVAASTLVTVISQVLRHGRPGMEADTARAVARAFVAFRAPGCWEDFSASGSESLSSLWTRTLKAVAEQCTASGKEPSGSAWCVLLGLVGATLDRDEGPDDVASSWTASAETQAHALALLKVAASARGGSVPRSPLIRLALAVGTNHPSMAPSARSALVSLTKMAPSADDLSTLSDGLVASSGPAAAAAVAALACVPALTAGGASVSAVVSSRLYMTMCAEGEDGTVPETVAEGEEPKPAPTVADAVAVTGDGASLRRAASALWACLAGEGLDAAGVVALRGLTSHENERVRVAACVAFGAALRSGAAGTSDEDKASAIAGLFADYGDMMAAVVAGRPVHGRGGWNAEERAAHAGRRAGLAAALGACADSVRGKESVVSVFGFLARDQRALADESGEVRRAFVDAGVAIVNSVGGAVPELQGLLEEALAAPAKNSDDDAVREGVVVFLGAHARHLPEGDPRVGENVQRLMDALSTPSESVQRAVAGCLAPLMSGVKKQEGAAETHVRSLLERLLDPQRGFAERRGAAFGLAGSIKGLGIPSLKKYEVMTALTAAIGEKTPTKREGACMAFETLSLLLGRLFEPYVIGILPHLLTCFGDSVPDVRTAAQDASKAIMGHLSAHGVKLVLPALLKGLEEDAWRAKQGSVRLLGAVAYMAPRQLSSSLPIVIPVLMDVLTDSHAKVQQAGQDALQKIGSVIRNPEIQAVAPAVLKALADPVGSTGKALDALLATAFVHRIDPASLALIVPLLLTAMRSRDSDVKRKAASVVGNMTTLTEGKDLSPYLTQLEPALRTTLVDPIPAVRATSARAVGTLVRGLGEGPFVELVPWLLTTMKSTESTVSRAGAAQGLAEVLSGLGPAKFAEVWPVIVAGGLDASSPETRQGYMETFVFFPGSLVEEFGSVLPEALPVLLRGLADENEGVRDIAMRGGRMIVSTYCREKSDLLFPSLQEGLTDDNWRIREASVTLLGSMLYLLAGASGNIQTSGDDDEESVSTEKQGKALVQALGMDRRNEVLAALYIVRSDVSPVVRQASLHVWKSIVSNTPRTLREILTKLTSVIARLLASPNGDKRGAAGRALGALVAKLGDRVLPTLIPILEEGLSAEEPDTREGMCLGLSELMRATDRSQLGEYLKSMIPAVRRALTDPSGEVREAAGAAFDTLCGQVGGRAVEEVLPGVLDLLVDLSRVAPDVAAEDSLAVRGVNPYAIDALRQMLSVRSPLVLPALVPALMNGPLTVGRAEVLKIVSEEGSAALHHFVPRLLPFLIREISAPGEGVGPVAEEAAVTMLTNVKEEAGHIVMGELMTAVGVPDANERAAGMKMMGLYASSGVDLTNNMEAVLRVLLYGMTDKEAVVVKAAHGALGAVTAGIRKEDQPGYIGFVRSVLSTLDRITTADGEKGIIAGFALPRGLKPLLPMFQQGLMFGTPAVRESAAGGLGDLIRATPLSTLKPFVVTITGPLIRIIGDRFPAEVKAAILSTLSLLIAKSGLMVKAFLPQLQTTFVKALQDGNRVVRTRAAEALGRLIGMATRVDPVVTELVNGARSNGDTGVQEAMLKALHGVVTVKGSAVSAPVLASLAEALPLWMVSEDKGVRVAAGAAAGAWAKAVGPDVSRPWLEGNLVGSAPDGAPDYVRHGRISATSSVIEKAVESTEGLADGLWATLMGGLADPSMDCRLAGVNGVGAVLAAGAAFGGGGMVAQALTPLMASVSGDELDVRRAALGVVKTWAKEGGVRAEDRAVVVPVLMRTVKDRNITVKLASERALLYVLGMGGSDAAGLGVVEEYAGSLSDPLEKKAVSEYASRVLSKLDRDSDDEE